jgi:hypothetical protein
MKYVALAICVLAVLPAYLIFRNSPYVRNNLWLALGLLPFLSMALPFLDVALISWGEFWTGYVPGLQVSAIDVLCVVLYFSVSNRRNSIHYHLPFVLYLTALSLSVFQAEMPLASTFSVWQFARIYFVTVVIAKACTEPFEAQQLLKGMAIGLLFQFVTVLYQKFVGGMTQPTGLFAHQNTLGLILHLVICPHFAMLLAGQRQLQSGATLLMGLAIAALIASRASLGFAAFGSAMTYFVSIVHNWRTRKAAVGLAGAAAVAILTPIALSSLETRFEAAPLFEDRYDERAAFNRAAISILEANPWGVGANHYSFVGKNYGYSVSAGVAPIEGSLNNIVHNAYLLAGAEAGYFGVFAFSFLMVFPILVAFRYAWAARGARDGDLLCGLGVGMATVCLHSFYEYIVVIKEVQYVLAIIVGITFGYAHQVKTRQSRRTSKLLERRPLTRNLDDRARASG